MAVQVEQLERKFKFNGKELPDPDPNAKPEEVLELYSRQYPSLTNGKIAGPTYEGTEEHWELKGSYGTKG